MSESNSGANGGGGQDNTEAKAQKRALFSQRLAGELQQKGWTGAELARRAGLTKATVWNYLRGTTLATLATMVRLAKALGVDLNGLARDIFTAEVDLVVAEENRTPHFSLEHDPGNADRFWLDPRQWVSHEQALRIMQLAGHDHEQ